ncbi:MAG: EAL domain-containing protein [Solirubrobacteraceae bacterium]|nr:EAL domain-containing protein [Solirubrobacteraceae bacterium]
MREPAAGRISVLVAEDDEPMRSALAALVEAEPDLALASAVGTAAEAITAAEDLLPDVALLDVRMPGTGVHAARELRRRVPGCRVLALSAAEDRRTVFEMLEAGVVGYLVKGASVDEISNSIRRAASGQSTLSGTVAGGVISELAGELQSRRERDEQLRDQRAVVRALIEEPGCLSIVLQPVCRLDSGELVGHEALARFDREPRQAPDLWFRAADEVGEGADLEVAALERALRRLEELPADTFLAVNGSPSLFTRADVQRLLGGVASERIVLEITEHAPVADYDELAAGLQPMRRRGVRLAIDDAGAGYASLRHILRLLPDLIKLDRTLVAGIEEDRARQALASGIISFADKMGIGIVAEGIEVEAELQTLRALGVPYGQGYLLARPGRAPLQAAVPLPGDRGDL